MNKKHGWVRQNQDTGLFVLENEEEAEVTEAFVFPTRKEAREVDYPYKLDTDIVRKVSLDEDGKPIEIIPGR